jgi:hypothetical protein
MRGWELLALPASPLVELTDALLVQLGGFLYHASVG